MALFDDNGSLIETAATSLGTPTSLEAVIRNAARSNRSPTATAGLRPLTGLESAALAAPAALESFLGGPPVSDRTVDFFNQLTLNASGFTPAAAAAGELAGIRDRQQAARDRNQQIFDAFRLAGEEQRRAEEAARQHELDLREINRLEQQAAADIRRQQARTRIEEQEVSLREQSLAQERRAENARLITAREELAVRSSEALSRNAKRAAEVVNMQQELQIANRQLELQEQRTEVDTELKAAQTLRTVNEARKALIDVESAERQAEVLEQQNNAAAAEQVRETEQARLRQRTLNLYNELVSQYQFVDSDLTTYEAKTQAYEDLSATFQTVSPEALLDITRDLKAHSDLLEQEQERAETALDITRKAREEREAGEKAQTANNPLVGSFQ